MEGHCSTNTEMKCGAPMGSSGKTGLQFHSLSRQPDTAPAALIPGIKLLVSFSISAVTLQCCLIVTYTGSGSKFLKLASYDCCSPCVWHGEFAIDDAKSYRHEFGSAVEQTHKAKSSSKGMKNAFTRGSDYNNMVFFQWKVPVTKKWVCNDDYWYLHAVCHPTVTHWCTDNCELVTKTLTFERAVPLNRDGTFRVSSDYYT
eukprot:scaffold130408_cov18-Tisochrysis_lutea.AAC.1